MLKNKTVVITGGAGLLGQEFVRAVIENNGFAIIADINIDNANQVVEQIKKQLNTENIEFIGLDITSLESVKNVIEKVSIKHGKIDAVVNNAYPRNKNYGRIFEEVTYFDFCENVNIHLGGYFLVSQQFAEFFKKQGWGNVINISSIYGVVAPRFEIYNETKMTMPVEYAAIKSAVIHLTKYMAKYYKGRKIRFNCLSSGGILDNQPVSFIDSYKQHAINKGMLDKADLKGALAFLLSDFSLFINGQNIIVDDGWSL